MNKEELTQQWERDHQELTDRFYTDKAGFPGGPAAFKIQHANIWNNYKAAMQLIGALPADEGPAPKSDIELIIELIKERLAVLESKLP